MRLSDLQNKDVVDVDSGQRIGSIIDVEISKDTGNIIKIIIYEKKGFINMLKGDSEVEIKWNQIRKIGADVILVSRNI